jgi:hypothetical protein
VIKAALDAIALLEEAILDHFGRKQTWRVLPLDDQTESHWMVVRGELVSSEAPFTRESIASGEAIFSAEIRGDVLRAGGFAMIEIDTNVDGNVFLAVLDERLECKDPSLMELYDEHW